MLTQQDLPAQKPSWGVLLGVVFSLCIGILAVLLGLGGLLGKGGAGDRATALPNLLTGIASIAGAIDYLRLKKAALPVYALAVIGHFVTHGILLVSHLGSGRMTVAGMVSMWIVPVLALCVLIGIERQRRRGALS